MSKNKTQQHRIKEIFNRLNATLADPQIELNFINDYTLLVAIILSAQTTDKQVNKITPTLFQKADRAQKMLSLGLEELINHIKYLGLYQNKAKNIIAMSQILCTQYQEKVPDNFEELIKLPGVGRKSANVFLNTVHNLPVIGVDTHVFRVSNRLGLVNSKNLLTVEKTLYQVIPKKWHKNAHHQLVLHGRYTCKAKKPQCGDCILSDLCPAKVG
jgi:endonuclease-3